MSARDRLLLAAAKAYAEAYNFPPENTIGRARWIGRQRPDPKSPQADQILKLELTYNDVLELAKHCTDAERYQQWYENEKRSLDSWFAALGRARKILSSGRGEWKKRASDALREIGLIYGPKRKKNLTAMVQRLIDLEAGEVSKTDALEIVAAEESVTVEAIKKRLQRLTNEDR